MSTPLVVLLTGHPGVGKSTFARPLAESLGAVCLSKDEIRYRVFDGWQPSHPCFDGVDELQIGNSTLSEDSIVWSVFFWAVREAANVAPVVAEIAMTKPANRTDTAAFIASLDVPVIEVLLEAPVDRLVERWRARATAPDAHPIRGRYQLGTEHRLLSTPYEPLLDEAQLVVVDATEPAQIDVLAVASAVRLLAGRC